MNAVIDALHGTGVRNIDMPLLPDRVCEAITQRHDVSGAPPVRTTEEQLMQDWGVLEEAGELARRGEAFALATVVWRQGPSSGQQGARAIITADGELHGWIGGACAEPVVIREARSRDHRGRAAAAAARAAGAVRRRRAVRWPGRGARGMTFVPISCQSEGALEVYVEPVLPTPHLVIVGRSPMAQTLADLARALGWRAELLDGPDFTAADADESAIVVVATQGHGDEEAIEQAVAARPAYVGLVASPKRGEAVLGYLADRGVPQDLLDRVQVPVGLDLGHTTHREIAVAILAELVQLRAAGQVSGGAPARSGKEKVGEPERAGRGKPAEAVDPVCGMTVAAGRSSFPLEHEGVTYYFCCAGCRQAFEAIRRPT